MDFIWVLKVILKSWAQVYKCLDLYAEMGSHLWHWNMSLWSLNGIIVLRLQNKE